MLKKISALVLAIALVMVMGTTAFAQTNVSPRFKYLTAVSASLSKSGSISADAYGIDDITKIVITVSLQEKSGTSWSTAETWSAETTYDTVASFYDSASTMEAGTSYRAKAVIKAYCGTVYETTTVYSNTVTA